MPPALLPITVLLLSLPSSETAYKDDPCEEEVDAGPCQYYQIKWFWDTQDEACKEFHYGGCMGTRNRFNTKHACVKQCRYKLHNPVSIPDLCLLDADQGNCGDERAGQWWFFFNSETGMCEKFFYHGCGGNDNRFYSLHLCRKVCAERLSPQIACDACDLRTSICKTHSKFNYTCECRMGYEKNVAGECVDIDECRGGVATCDRNAWCANTVGSYQCDCMASYRGDGRTCTYVGLGRSTLDCAECSPDASCLNGVCQCKQGFQGDGFNCTDVNECMRIPYVCHKNAECVNREGSFICTCLPGYAGNGYSCTQEKTSCLDKFDVGYQQTCGGENWREHFYFDHTTKSCALFWYDGCHGKSRNIYSEVDTCAAMCEETNVLTRARRPPHNNHNPPSMAPTPCPRSSYNVADGHDHEVVVVTLPPSSPDIGLVLSRLALLLQHFQAPAEICWDKFDMVYRNQCQSGNWQQRFYFDHASLTCRPFWYDGCRSSSRNMFEDSLTCQWLCEAQPMYKSRSCLEDFDHHYKEMCNGGKWRQQFYFDRQNKKCVPFWYDGCTGTSQNLFPDELTCTKTCEDPAMRDRGPPPPRPRQEKVKEIYYTHAPPRTRSPTTPSAPRTISAIKPWHSNDKARMKEELGQVFRPNSTNVCETANPCRNNATCIFAWKKNTYYCKCKGGWTGSHCTEVIAFDPCALFPCKNGATCKAKHEKGKTTHECYCPTGFGGVGCDQRPCDSNPCQNNGTCRTTVAASAFFCDCPNHFGGKACEFEIGSPPKESFGEKVEQVSSGTIEWVENMKKRLGKNNTAAATVNPQADEEYKDPETKKRERMEREKEADEYKRMQDEQAKREAQELASKEEEARKQREAELAEMASRNSAISLGLPLVAFGVVLRLI